MTAGTPPAADVLLAGTRVLVAEDEAMIAEALSLSLTRLGLVVIGVADSADEAIAVVRDSRPSLVMMDIRLKGARDGIDAAAEIRDRFGVPVVFLTAHADDATLQRAKQSDPFGYLVKPYSERDLRVTLEIALHRHALEQLERAQRLEAIGRLAGGVAHDVNNMMTVVIGYAQVLGGLERDAGRLEMIEQIERAGHRSATMTQHLLAFARRQVLRPEPTDLAEVVGAARGRLERLAGERVTLEIDCPRPVGTACVDRVQIEQVLADLVENARDAMPDGGRLCIGLRDVTLDAAGTRATPEMQPGAYVQLTVADTGVGMDPQTTAHVFEPFFTTKAVGEGMGLGLATVYGTIKQSNGFIYVRSELARGTTFTIYLPSGGRSQQ
jgi:signal transduction histidine kinase